MSMSIYVNLYPTGFGMSQVCLRSLQDPLLLVYFVGKLESKILCLVCFLLVGKAPLTIFPAFLVCVPLTDNYRCRRSQGSAEEEMGSKLINGHCVHFIFPMKK